MVVGRQLCVLRPGVVLYRATDCGATGVWCAMCGLALRECSELEVMCGVRCAVWRYRWSERNSGVRYVVCAVWVSIAEWLDNVQWTLYTYGVQM